MAKEKYIGFEMSEEEIRKNFLDWVIIGDNTPIDIAYKANITKVEKVLYPVRNVRCNYTASWSAFSIWEEEEEYEVQVEMITYASVRDDGSFIGRNTKTREEYEKLPCHGNVKILDRYYKPQKKTRTVIADQHDTSGEIKGCYEGKVVKTENGISGFDE